MEDIDDYLNMLIDNNNSRVYQNVVNILHKICDDIIKFPDDIKYRKVRIADPQIADTLMSALGAVELLFQLGFEEDDEFFTLPMGSPLFKIHKILNTLGDVKKKFEKAPSSVQSINATRKQLSENSFFSNIANTFANVLKYENKELQRCVKSIIPIDMLKLNAIKQLRHLQKNLKHNSKQNRTAQREFLIEDILVMEIMHWFKNEFFTWMNSPECTKCTGDCKYTRDELTNNEKISRIEIHTCQTCGHEEQFPRYTDLKILLSTRTGRCGEWANVFTLVCRTFGYDARIVYDTTDHVWTEVWSVSFNRWVHLDACEDIFDRPFTYELGWNKQIAYIIAYSKEEIQDVTWRYVKYQLDAMNRRKLCSEVDLLNFIQHLNDKRLKLLSESGYSKARENYVIKRRAMELAELLPAPPGKSKPGDVNDISEYGGRISGDAAWRAARGELSASNSNRDSTKPHVWEIPHGVHVFELQYFIVKDIYHILDVNNEIISAKEGWKEGVNFYKGGIIRKEEKDWKMVYLCRSSGSDIGVVKWSVELKDEEFNIDLFEFYADIATFSDGNVKWTIESFSYDNSVKKNLPVPDCKYFKTDELKGMHRINIIAELSGGSGDIAWQYAQLFRKKLNAVNECCMRIRCKLSKN